MADRSATDLFNLRLPLYAYAKPLWTGRRVLEIGCDDGDSATYLATQGADRVVVIDSDLGQIERARSRFPHPRVDYRPAADLRQMGVLDESFDFVIVPDGKSLVGNRNLLLVLRRILSAAGHIMISVRAGDRRAPAPADGIGYYELVDALEGQFPVVRMLGRTPFLGFGLVEFDSATDALRVDATLLQGKSEPPSHYVAIAGNTAPPTLGYALVQVPFHPLEAALQRESTSESGGGAGGAAGEARSLPDDVAERLEAARVRLTAQNAEIARLLAQVSRLTVELDEAQASLRALTQRTTVPTAARGSGPPPLPGAGVAAAVSGGLDAVASATRAELAERRLEEVEQRTRARIEEMEGRLFDLRKKLEEALLQAESAVRVSRVQGEEIEELRGRLRRASEDRQVTDGEMARLRRALADADESVLSLTRKSAEEMALVAHQIASGLRASAAERPAREPEPASSPVGRVSGTDGGELAARLKRAEELAVREHAELVEARRQLHLAEGEAQTARQRAALVGERDERIARLEADRQDLLSKVSALEEQRRLAAVDSSSRGAAPGDEVRAARAERDRAIEELHRAAAAHAREAARLRASLDEQAALVVELEDALRVTEARAVAADKDAASLRRGAKELEEADRTRRGRLAELEGKLLRLERVGAAGGRPSGDDSAAEWRQKLGAMEQRALAAEQRAVGLEERLAAAQTASAASESVMAVAPLGAPGVQRNGTHGALDGAQLQAAIEDVEQQLRHEMRMLGAIEDTLTRARDEVSRALEANAAGTSGSGGAPRGELEQTLAHKDAELGESRLEMNRLRQQSEARQVELERELDLLRTKVNPFGKTEEDQNQSTQLIVMHTTLANIRRRAARLRDELEGFRRRLDSLPPGALSSLLEEIGEDLGEFAK